MQMTNYHFSICNLRFAFAILPLSLFLSSPARAESPLAVPVDGDPFRAELVAADAKWQLTFAAAGQQKVVPAANLVRWGQCSEQGRGDCPNFRLSENGTVPLSAAGRAETLVLADGSLLTAEVVAADKDRLTVDSNLFGTLKLPLESLAGVVFHAPSDQRRHDSLLDRLARASGETDRLILDNGDELTGLFDGLADNTVTLKTDVGSVPIKSDRIVAILFNPTLRTTSTRTSHAPREEASDADRSTLAWAAFSDGSRLLATQLLVAGDSLKLTAAGRQLAAPRSSLVFLQPLAGRAVYLSDLKPAEYRQTPFLTLSWPYQSDRNVTGGLLRSGGRLYMKGISVHSAARLVYNLDNLSPLPLAEKQQNNSPLPLAEGQHNNSPLPLGEGQGVRAVKQNATIQSPEQGQGLRAATRFDAQVGIDDSTAGQGSVIFRVMVDGQERFASPTLRGGDAPVPVSVDVRGAKKLELLVDYADRADVLDHADWLDARLTQ